MGSEGYVQLSDDVKLWAAKATSNYTSNYLTSVQLSRANICIFYLAQMLLDFNEL